MSLASGTMGVEVWFCVRAVMQGELAVKGTGVGPPFWGAYRRMAQGAASYYIDRKQGNRPAV